MGQQETTMTMATEEKGGGTLFRRMILVLAVAAVMAVMLVAMAAPAFAVPGHTAQSLESNRGTSQNSKGDAKNTFAGNNRGGSFAFGDFLN